MKNFLVIVIAIIGLCSFNAEASIVNGSFEEGFTNVWVSKDWATYGIHSSIGDGAVSPTDGNNFLYLSTGPGETEPIGGVDNVQCWTNITISETTNYISFDVNMLTEQPTPANFYEDKASVYMGGTGIRPPAFYGNTKEDLIEYKYDKDGFNLVRLESPFQWINGNEGVYAPEGSHFTKQTGWHSVFVDVSELPTGYNLQLIFEIFDYSLFDQLGDSALLIDNINEHEFSPVPIPGAAWLLGSGFLGLVGFRHKFRK